MISLTAVPLLRAATRVNASSFFANLAPNAKETTESSASSTGAHPAAAPRPSAAEALTGQHALPLAVVVGTEATGERLASLLLHGTTRHPDVDDEGAATAPGRALTAEQIRVEPVIRMSWPQELAALDEAIQRIVRGELDWLVLLSRTAGEFLLDRCNSLEVPPEALARLRVACVGTGTAEAAEALGLEPAWLPTSATGAALVKEALASEVFRGQRLLVPRSAIGDDEMLEPLRTQVAELHLVSAYENRPQPIDEAAWQQFAQLNPGPVVAFLSSSAVTALWSGLPLAVQEQLARHARWLAIGPSTAETMHQVHWPPQAVAEPPGLEALAELVKREVAALHS